MTELYLNLVSWAYQDTFVTMGVLIGIVLFVAAGLTYLMPDR